MDKGLKRLKRKRKLQGRMRCHGDKSACTHHKKPILKVEKKVELTWWQKLLKWFHL